MEEAEGTNYGTRRILANELNARIHIKICRLER